MGRAEQAGGIAPPGDLLDQLGRGSEQGAAEQVAMTVQRLGRRMEDEVAAERQRTLAAWRRQGVVGEDEGAGPVGLLRPHGDVGQAQQRIAGGLDPDQSGLARERGGEGGIVAHVDEIGGQPSLVLEAADQAEGAAVAIVRRDDMRARRQQQQGEQSRRLSAVGNCAPGRALELGQHIGQHVPIGADRARIIIVGLGVGVGPLERVRGPQRRRDAAIGRILVRPRGGGDRWRVGGGS